MSFSLKDRHLLGTGAAACAVCCAAPVLTVLGVAGAAAAVATFLLAGVVFGLVVAGGALFAVWQQRHRPRRVTPHTHGEQEEPAEACSPSSSCCSGAQVTPSSTALG